ncbi:MAG: hypothetical protein DRI95_02260 [Bacteroidetes bacterium]|nr:MAG: hypothetical protein DRI95_02260 [Bacteroidota bacterium]
MKINYSKIFVLLLFISFFIKTNAQEYFQLRGRIITQEKVKLGGAKYKLYKNGEAFDSTLTSSNGTFTLKFELNNVYLIEFSKKGYTTKKMIVDSEVPNEKISGFYDQFIIIKLDSAGQGDLRSEAGLPALKYRYNPGTDDFISEIIVGKVKTGGDVTFKRVKELENQLLLYQSTIERQKVELDAKRSLEGETNIILQAAKDKADSIVAVANKRALRILAESKKDSANRTKKVDRIVSSDISNDEFKELSVNEDEFKNKEKVKSYKKRIKELTDRQNKSAADSLNLKENRLSLRREFFDLAKAQLEIDRLNVKTHDDSIRIEQREAELFLIGQTMEFAAQEIENAKKELKLKDLEIQKKNLILYGVLFGLVLVLVLLVVIYFHYRDKKRMNVVLASQNKELATQNNQIILQNKQLEKQNHQIMASINYGKRIQDAILPSNKLLNHFFQESFVFFLPRDVVSGDFYWFSIQDDKLFVAAVDCTGHGVPGAFMSLIGNSLLNYIVNERGIHKPSEILKELHVGVNKALSQSMSENNDHVDGMDITLCRFEKSTKEVQLSCANHTAFVINNGEVEEIEGDEFSIADELIGEDIPEFTNHVFPMNKNATLYMFSDGFPDQMGGPKGKKYYTGNLKKLLVENQKLDASAQFDVLEKTFNEWKGNNKQLDDVLVMGFKLDFE